MPATELKSNQIEPVDAQSAADRVGKAKTMSPVFLVGPSRCGTTMLQAALNSHDNINISAETHWFDDERCQRFDDIDNEEERVRIQNWFMALSHKPFGHGGYPEEGWLARSTLEDGAQDIASDEATQHSRDNYFLAYCKLDAEQHGKTRWGEKTPRHVFRINDILQAFPNAKIVCILRDPRAMVASYRQWSMRENYDLYTDQKAASLTLEKKRTRDSYHPVITALLWRGAARAGFKARKAHGDDKVRVVRYEELVTSPKETLQSLTEWLGESFDASMMNVPIINSSFDDSSAGAGFHHQAIDRWKQQLSRAEQAVVRVLCAKEMRDLDYKHDENSSTIWPLYAVKHFATFPVAVYKAWKVNKDRTGNIWKYIWRRISI